MVPYNFCKIPKFEIILYISEGTHFGLFLDSQAHPIVGTIILSHTLKSRKSYNGVHYSTLFS
jgi:hypothetical protein